MLYGVRGFYKKHIRTLHENTRGRVLSREILFHICSERIDIRQLTISGCAFVVRSIEERVGDNRRLCFICTGKHTEIIFLRLEARLVPFMVIGSHEEFKVLFVHILRRIPVKLKPGEIIPFLLTFQFYLHDTTISHNRTFRTIKRIGALDNATPQLYPNASFRFRPVMRTARFGIVVIVVSPIVHLNSLRFSSGGELGMQTTTRSFTYRVGIVP